jgi:predicted dehydrogenase
MTRGPLRVAIIGCGLIGRKRAEALGPTDELVGCVDVVPEAAAALARDFGGSACTRVDEVLALGPDVVVVATSHDQLAHLAEQALAAGAHVLVEKPAGISGSQVAQLAHAADRAERLVKVGFNHRFHPALARAAAEVHSGDHGPFMHLRARYGHGGRPGYDREWRADPSRSGGGELIDQGMHLLDLTHWIAGPLPFHSALLRTHFWDTPAEDNAAVILGVGDDRAAPWAMLHVSWTEWKNTFSLEIYCRTAKIEVDGLVRSYGPQRLRIYRMRAEMGPPDVQELAFGAEDVSWAAEWEHFARVIGGGGAVLGSLADARYAWDRIEEVYAAGPYAEMRERVPA